MLVRENVGNLEHSPDDYFMILPMKGCCNMQDTIEEDNTIPTTAPKLEL